MLVVFQVVCFHGVLIAEIGVWGANFSPPVEVTSSAH